MSRSRLQDFLENLVGTSSAQFGNDRFHVVVGDLAAKDANVLQELLDSFDGLVRLILGCGSNRGGRGKERGVTMALKDEFLLETRRDFLLVIVGAVLFQGILQSSNRFLTLGGNGTSSENGGGVSTVARSHKCSCGGSKCSRNHCDVLYCTVLYCIVLYCVVCDECFVSFLMYRIVMS